MQIAQVAPLYESVPPKYYGGTERVVSYLTEALVRDGHDVTLFASADSVTTARLVAGCRRALRLDRGCLDPVALHIALLEEVFAEADGLDVLHFHLEYLHLPLAVRQPAPHVTTRHNRLDLPELTPLHRRFRRAPMVSVSDAQRAAVPWLNWQATVHHGLPEDLYAFRPGPGRYLAFLGRISPEKRVDRAIEVARRLGLRIRIAAKVDDIDRAYFESTIAPLLEQPHAEYVGEVGDSEKGEFLGNAMALLFPIDWPEPFGMVMIEAMACGTPVIAYRRGSVPEVLEEGVTGYSVDDLDGAVHAVERALAGWGIRTVAATERRYNPMSYHNGSVWPHDNALVALGLARYGLNHLAVDVLGALFDASLYMDLHRMPELFCGFHPRPAEGPTLYPVACAPQSWAAASVFMLLQACLGMTVDAPAGRIVFRRPALPRFLEFVEVRNLRVGRSNVDLLLERHAHNVGVNVLRRDGPLQIETVS